MTEAARAQIVREVILDGVAEPLAAKGLTPTDCAKMYVRYCLMNLPYNADAFREVADCAPLTGTQYKAVQKALQKRLAMAAQKRCLLPAAAARGCGQPRLSYQLLFPFLRSFHR